MMENFWIRDNGIVAVAATLKPVIPPPGNKYINGVRDVGSKHIPQHRHSFSQGLFIRLCFHTF